MVSNTLFGFGLSSRQNRNKGEPRQIEGKKHFAIKGYLFFNELRLWNSLTFEMILRGNLMNRVDLHKCDTHSDIVVFSCISSNIKRKNINKKG